MTDELNARIDRLERQLAWMTAELASVRALVVAAPAAPPEPVIAAPIAPSAPVSPPPVEQLSAWVDEPPAPPPSPKRQRRSLGQLAEDWDLVGARGFAIAGGVVMALGIGLFFILAANRGWIDERARVALGALASGLAVGAGLLLRRKFGQYLSALAAVGAGVAGAYATLAAAAARYDLVPDAIALPLAGAIAAVATVIAVRWRSQIIAGIGLGGAALAPALQAIDTGMTWGSGAFAVIVLAATGAVAVTRQWDRLLVAITVIVGGQVLLLAADAGTSPEVGAVAVGAALAAALLGIGIALQLARSERDLDPLALSYVLAGFGATVVLTLLLFEERDDRGIAFFVAAGAWAVVTAALGWRRQAELGLVAGTSALALAAVGTALLLTDSALAVAWAAESVVFAVVAWRFRDVRLQLMCFAYAALATSWALGHEGDPRLLLDPGEDHLAGVLPLASVTVGAVAAAALWPREYRMRTESGVLEFIADLRKALAEHARGGREAFAVAGAGLGTLAAAFALVAASFDIGHVAASTLAALVGALLLGYGGRAGSDGIVAASLVWLGAVLTEALVFDSSAFGDSDVGAIGGWSVIAAAAGLLGGTYALHVFQHEREEWDVISGIAAGGGLVAAWIGLTDLTASDDARGIGLLFAAGVYVGLAAFVFRRAGLRTFSTTLWAVGLTALVGAERLVFESDVLIVIALAATGAVVGALAAPLREERLWIAGAVVAGLGTAVALVAVTPPTHFFSASGDPGRGLVSLVLCALALAALSKLAEGRVERIVAGVAAGGVAVYAVSLGILELAMHISTASIETDFERGHTGVSALWALIGLGLLVFGLYRRSTSPSLLGTRRLRPEPREDLPLRPRRAELCRAGVLVHFRRRSAPRRRLLSPAAELESRGARGLMPSGPSRVRYSPRWTLLPLRKSSSATTPPGTPTTSARSWRCTHPGWCSRTTRQPSGPRATRSALTSRGSSRTGPISLSVAGGRSCGTGSS